MEHEAPNFRSIQNQHRCPRQNYTIFLLANLSVDIPSHPLYDRPADCALSNLFTPKEKGNPQNKDNSADAGHFSVSDTVSMDCDPGVRVKAKKKAESRLKGQLGDNDFTSNWTIAVNSIHKRNIRSLCNAEVDCPLC
jgi:hypothetical protein